MDQIITRVKDWNERMRGLPRKLGLIAIVLLSCLVLLALLPYVWPFVVALLFAMLMDPLVRLLRRAFKKIPFGKSLATLIGMVVVYGLIGWLFMVLTSRLIQELMSLARAAPGMLANATSGISAWVNNLIVEYQDALPENIASIINNVLNEVTKMLLDFARSISSTIASGAWATATSFPLIILSVILTIMSTFFMSSDRERIFAFFRRNFPEKTVEKAISLKKNIFHALFGQMKSQATLSLGVTLITVVGLTIQGVPYSLVIGLGIGIADALPVVGAGLFLIPWSVISFIIGDTTRGIGMAVLFLIIDVFRYVAEPRIVGRNLGLYPLATMMSIFAGYTITGSFLGMLLGPILLNICKVVLAADQQTPVTLEKPLLAKAFRMPGSFRSNKHKGEKPPDMKPHDEATPSSDGDKGHKNADESR